MNDSTAVSWDTTSTTMPNQYQSQDYAAPAPVDVPEAVQAPDPVPVPVSEASTVCGDSRKIRAWALAQGIPVGKRGRLKPDVIARYNEAHGATA